MRKFRPILLATSIAGGIYILGMLLVRLHMTQLAYSFEEKKEFERSLKEEQRRLKASIAEKLSLENLKTSEFEEPSANHVVFIP